MSQLGLAKSFRAYMKETSAGDSTRDETSSNDQQRDQESDINASDLESNWWMTSDTVDAPNRVLRYLYPGYFESDAKAQIPLFEDESGITVTDEQTPAHATGTRKTYTTLFDHDETQFDVGHMDVIWPTYFSENEWAEPVDDRENYTDDMIKVQVDTVTVDGELRAMPIHTDANVLYYREDKLEEYGYSAPPKTDSELVDIAQDILDRDDEIEHGFIWQGGQNEGLTIMWLNWLWGRNGDLVDGDDIVVDTKAGVDALRHAVNLIHVYDVTPESVTHSSTDKNRKTFQTGNTLFMRNWPYAVSRLDDGTPVSDDFSVAPLPVHEEHPDANNACLGGWNLFINPESDQKAAAQEFLEWMASEEVQRRLALDHSRLPVRKSVYDDEDVREEFETLDVFEQALEQSQSRPSITQYPRFSEIVFTECNAALCQEKTPSQALSDAQSKIDMEVN
ncbi:extracellular solute-binding protein [Natronorubrum sp. JWXQ-INN-674]|uniref:Extracellular solute-binding protein n=1 Tax=Natronorubrum halalkaliphilum TaxID=2691917 RepID=A0A6B0VK04_9EURY|nr:ABC transporter substrate-binding protein [Natronorubrum halalkaliphilum]MXV61874.1 extracellular solute-binding protein [Natronorubrum halalkaliphilum]